MEEQTDFFKGWLEALESLQTRLEAMLRTVAHDAKPHDVLLDVQTELNDLKNVSLELTTIED